MNSARYGLVMALCLLLCACSSSPSHTSMSAPLHAPPKAYVIPPEFSLSAFAERGPEGEIYISGTTNFPDGMKMWVVLGSKKAQQDAFVRGGKFRSGPLYKGVAVPITGTQPLEVIAYFNGAWQTNSVLSALGDGGKNLQGKLFMKTDPDVVDSDKTLNAKFSVVLPAVPPEVIATNAVKHAILYVPGLGKSATNIEENIALFTQPGTGVRPSRGWSAKSVAGNVYNVEFSFIDGSAGEKQAVWSVNTATKQVKYVNAAAKTFSWTPNY